MREKMYRAWYEKSQTWVYVHIGQGMTDEGLKVYREMCIDGVEWYGYADLEDKNSVKMFEGDIVNFAVKKTFCKEEECEERVELGISKYCPECGRPVTHGDFITRAEIVFKQGSFCFREKHGGHGISDWATYIAENYIEWIEIIGNVQENPELLEENKS